MPIPDRVPVPRLEQPRRGEAGRKPPITGYLLCMSWSPQHCADVRNPKNARDRFQCAGEDGRFGWVLHGLWPKAANSGYPQWCRAAKIVPAPVLRSHMCMTPSTQLLQHEWAKHGTCMSPHPAAYFRAAAILFRAVRFARHEGARRQTSDRGEHSPRLCGRQSQHFRADDRGGGNDKGWLDEVRLCLGPRMRPQRCKSFQAGIGDRRPVRVRRCPSVKRLSHDETPHLLTIF